LRRLTWWFIIQALDTTDDWRGGQIVVSVLLFPYFTADRGAAIRPTISQQAKFS